MCTQPRDRKTHTWHNAATSQPGKKPSGGPPTAAEEAAPRARCPVTGRWPLLPDFSVDCELELTVLLK